MMLQWSDLALSFMDWKMWLVPVVILVLGAAFAFYLEWQRRKKS